MLQEWFWGTKLSGSSAEHKWLPTFSEADESADLEDVEESFNPENAEKTLTLTGAVLGTDAKEDELQEVELVTKDSREAEVTVTIAVLVAGKVWQAPLNVELPCVHATLRLKRGAGPVHLIGKEFVQHDIDPDEGMDEAEEEAVEEEEISAEGDAKPNTNRLKKRKLNGSEANGKQAAHAKPKRGKIEPPEEEEEEEDDGEDMEDSDEEDSPLAKGKQAKKPAKKTPAADKKNAAKSVKSPAAKKLSAKKK